MTRRFIDIEHMPGYNPKVINGVSSIRMGLVEIKTIRLHHAMRESALGTSGIPRDYPYCHRHGAMLRVSKEGIYRCGELGCDVGCFLIEE